MRFCGCGQSFLSYRFWSQEDSREGEEGEMEGGKKGKAKGDWRMDAQVLLLIDPGAELGWAELSERLPSAGGERKQDERQLAGLK